MKLTKKLPPKYSNLFLTLIFILGLACIFWLNYIFNIQYVRNINSLSNGPVTTLPKTLRLDLDSPPDESLTFQSLILISGHTAAYKDVLILTDSKDLVIKSKIDGSFSTSLDLDEGVNKITVVVFDSNGDTRTAERVVFFSEEKI